MAKFEHVFAAECEEIAARHEKQAKRGTAAPTNKHERLRQRIKTSPSESSQSEDARRPHPDVPPTLVRPGNTLQINMLRCRAPPRDSGGHPL